MQESTTINRCDVSYLVNKKRQTIDDISGKCIYQKHLSPMLEAKYFQWRKARYDGLAVGRIRDKGWWNVLDSQKQWQHWSNDETNEIVPTPSRSILEKLYNRLSNEADSPIRFAKRGLSVLLRARNTRIQIKRQIHFFCTFCSSARNQCKYLFLCELISIPLCSCAVGGRGDNSEAPEMSARCLQRHRRRGPRCGSRSSPRDRGLAGESGSERR